MVGEAVIRVVKWLEAPRGTGLHERPQQLPEAPKERTEALSEEPAPTPLALTPEPVPERYRLSDGRDARDLLRQVEELAAKADAQPRTGFERMLEAFHLAGRAITGSAYKFDFECALLQQGLTEDDLESLLHTANEQWQLDPRPTPENHNWAGGFRGDFLIMLKQRVTGEEGPGMNLLSSAPRDWRDADTIAEQFLAHVNRHAGKDGWENLDRHVEQARRVVMDGVPEGYRRKVLERMLDREEQALRDAGASTDEIAELCSDRTNRRARGWQTLANPGGEGQAR